MKSNQEIEKTLNSLDGITRAEASPFLYDKVMNRLQHREAEVVSINSGMLWKAAASFAILIALNVFVLTHNKHKENLTAQDNSNPMAKEYFSYFSNAQF